MKRSPLVERVSGPPWSGRVERSGRFGATRDLLPALGRLRIGHHHVVADPPWIVHVKLLGLAAGLD